MRALVAALLVLAALPHLAPTTSACHAPMGWSSSQGADVGILNRPDEPHHRPADFHWHECGDGHAWVCVHTRTIDECAQTW